MTASGYGPQTLTTSGPWWRDGDDLYIAAAINNDYDFGDTGYLKIAGQYTPGVDGLDYFEADTEFDNGFWTDQSIAPGPARVRSAPRASPWPRSPRR